MTTIAEPRPVVTGGVEAHLDLHVAAVVTVVGGVLGTAEFPTRGRLPGPAGLDADLR